MSDQPNSILPGDQSRVLTELAGAVASARAKLTALRPALPPDGAEDDASPPWRQALDSIEFHRLPGLVGDLDDPALGLDETSPDPALDFRMQQALRDLLAGVAAIRGVLVPSSSASSAMASALPRTCSAILAAVLEFLSVAEVRLERQLAEPCWNPTEPPEVHLLAGARLGRLQIEAAIGEIQDGHLRFQEAIGNGDSAIAGKTGS